MTFLSKFPLSNFDHEKHFQRNLSFTEFPCFIAQSKFGKINTDTGQFSFV